MGVSGQIYSISLSDIEVSDFNVRLTDKNARIDELAESIEKHGLLQPVVLRGSHGNPPYELVVGQRRFRAHQKLNRDSIPAVFWGELPDINFKILSLAENMQRVELNHADKAEAITALYVHYNRDGRRVAQELGLSPSTVREYIKIEEQATRTAKDLLQQGRVRKADVKRAINAAQGDEAKLDRFLDEMTPLTKYEKDRAVSFAKSNPEAPVEQLIEEAKKPRFQRTVILNLTKEVDDALNQAKEQLSMDRDIIAANALAKWLQDNGFLKQEV
ncbi:MAG: Nucleoid occlusion protein [Dehalococcoidia bacterium]|nr:Nucleoid occlusion protein [Bacillota bacterium]